MLTGVLFAAVAAIWLVVLIPYYLRKRGNDEASSEELLVFSPSVTIVHSGDDLSTATSDAELISTPLTRKGDLSRLRQLEIAAASRRRKVLGFLLLVQLIVAVLAIFHIGDWWGVLIPAGLIVGFLAVARFSVKAMNVDLEVRRKAIMQACEEETVAISITGGDLAAYEQSVELSVPLGGLGSLWDPVPITRSTYVSQPLAARTVRTIDLSGPHLSGLPPTPSTPPTNDTAGIPTASADQVDHAADPDDGRAAGAGAA
ncbi:MAG: hypothetical protein LBU38_02005 [Propionibacteriaceae bacterium]|nr:hypothetical protein [Propionibacteriaceae bacterium]